MKRDYFGRPSRLWGLKTMFNPLMQQAKHIFNSHFGKASSRPTPQNPRKSTVHAARTHTK